MWSRNWASWLIAPALLLAAFLVQYCSNNNPPNPSPYPGRLDPIAGQWTAYGTGTGIIGQLSNPFAIPTQASGKTINYVYTAAASMAGTVTLNYSVTGPATFAPLPESGCGTGGCGPAQIRLFVWSKTPDTGNDRWWCVASKALLVGDGQSFGCSFFAGGWSGVNGQSADGSQAFAQSLANPFAVGFTFGGMFAGHGVWVTSGSATFKVNSFSIN